MNHVRTEIRRTSVRQHSVRRASSRRALRFWIGIGLLSVVLVSCGIPDDDRPREIDPALLENITDQT